MSYMETLQIPKDMKSIIYPLSVIQLSEREIEEVS